jgi:hypothetical protein
MIGSVEGRSVINPSPIMAVSRLFTDLNSSQFRARNGFISAFRWVYGTTIVPQC